MIMRLEEFADVVLTALREKVDGIFHACITTVVKNNGIELTGISVTGLDSDIGLCIYLNGYYKEYSQGHMEVSEIVESVCSQIMKHRDDLKGINITGLLRWDEARHHIYAKLINADKNRESLGMIPHRFFLDLAVVYYIKVSGDAANGDMASILVKNEHMQMWGQSEESLYQIAGINMRKDREPFFMDIEALLSGIMPEGWNSIEGCTDIKMYVLTNRNRIFGAVEIMDVDTLQNISEKLADDFIVLPSSIHETIIIPSCNAPGYLELKSMVCEVNATQVDAEERLSDHIYRYDRSEGRLKLAA